MFPLPGAPRQQAVDPTRLQALVNQPVGSANNSQLRTANAKQSKRVFAYNLPSGTTTDQLQDFFNLQMNGLNVVSGPDPCISAILAENKTFAMLEFKAPEDATYALALDGISLQDDGMNGAPTTGAQAEGGGLELRRPKDYIVPIPAAAEEDSQMGVVSSLVKDGPNKITVKNIPTYLTDENITELLVSFGELAAFILVKDSGTEQSKVNPIIHTTRTHTNPFLLGRRLLRIHRPNKHDHGHRKPQRHGTRRVAPRRHPLQHRPHPSRRPRTRLRASHVRPRRLRPLRRLRPGPRAPTSQHGHGGGAHG